MARKRKLVDSQLPFPGFSVRTESVANPFPTGCTYYSRKTSVTVNNSVSPTEMFIRGWAQENTGLIMLTTALWKRYDWDNKTATRLPIYALRTNSFVQSW